MDLLSLNTDEQSSKKIIIPSPLLAPTIAPGFRIAENIEIFTGLVNHEVTTHAVRSAQAYGRDAGRGRIGEAWIETHCPGAQPFASQIPDQVTTSAGKNTRMAMDATMGRHLCSRMKLGGYGMRVIKSGLISVFSCVLGSGLFPFGCSLWRNTIKSHRPRRFSSFRLCSKGVFCLDGGRDSVSSFKSVVSTPF